MNFKWVSFFKYLLMYILLIGLVFLVDNFSGNIWRKKYNINFPTANFVTTVINNEKEIFNIYDYKDISLSQKDFMKLLGRENKVKEQYYRLLSYLDENTKNIVLEKIKDSYINSANYYIIVEKNYKLCILLYDVENSQLYEMCALDVKSIE